MISITNIAKKHLTHIIKRNNSKALYLYLEGGGCNGFNYKIKPLQFDNKPNKIDENIKIDNIKFYICGKSLMYIIGTEIDYIEDIMGTRFHFNNNQISNYCGCGTSVNFKHVV